MSPRTLLIIAVTCLAAGAAAFLLMRPPSTQATGTPPPQGAALVSITMPSDLTTRQGQGQTAFEAKCSACHGPNATGRQDMGPPLIHKIYEPSHHGDGAFLRAVRQGVRGHHWTFGDMPPVDGLTNADVAAIVDFIRAVQRKNGID